MKGYLRYVDDFLLFGDSRAELRRQGAAAREKLAELRLEIHPDKYRLMPTAYGVDFAGYVVRADGRVRVRAASVRRFDRRYKKLLWLLPRGEVRAAAITQSVCAWTAHAAHAQSYGLRRSVLMGRGAEAGGRDRCAGSSRGLRGGSWNNNSNNLPSSNRNNNNPTNENNNIGFRVASS